ncbi:MAG: nucleoside-diphosphate sugar epimerase/dehydratase [Nostocaceae cyanobacterium]|nr:nucleoside-diphosphate sugar epimerase/dehydratase [Nostocaceae cyanobacterium]
MKALLFIYRWFSHQFLNPVLTKFIKVRNYHLLILDLVIFSSLPLLALFLRLDGNLNLNFYLSELGIVTIAFLVIKLTIFSSFGLYQRCWRYASVEDMTHITTLVGSAVVTQFLALILINKLPVLNIENIPISLPFIDGLLCCFIIGGLRFSVRVGDKVAIQKNVGKSADRVLIVGAGSAGVALVQEMQRNTQLGMQAVAFVDDNPDKLNLRIRGIFVVGNRYQIPEIVKCLNIHKVIIAMPTVGGTVIREIVDICQSTGAQTSTLPGIHEILNGRVKLNSIRDIRIEDLLRREPIQTDIERVSQFIQGKKVLITGAGGSIGSELCRQICKCRPTEIILVGHGENSVFNIQNELNQIVIALKNETQKYDYTPKISGFIADIRHRNRLEYAFAEYQPDVIFHAAAHKHVPLMELNSPEAITNNVIGTKNLVDLALKYNVNHFVMISTDKAVNPTNIMGASKRTAEMVVLQAAKESGKSYVVVRFGNVLGSRGSVVPTFQKQIAAGGPITVTHPEITRYFMTIPEAVQLVLQAAVLGRSGEVLMMNMGKPVKIVDLAKELIRLSGYELDKDIAIKFSGLRPGEKLFEELFIKGEEYEPTEHDKLFVVKNASRILLPNLNASVQALLIAATSNDTESIVDLLMQIVPGYKPAHLNQQVPSTMAKNTSIIIPKSSVSSLGKLKAKTA